MKMWWVMVETPYFDFPLIVRKNTFARLVLVNPCHLNKYVTVISFIDISRLKLVNSFFNNLIKFRFSYSYYFLRHNRLLSQ